MVTANSGVVVKNNGQDSAQLATTMAGDPADCLRRRRSLLPCLPARSPAHRISSYRTHKARSYDCAMEFTPRSDATVARRLDQALSIPQ
jgi:hypothetical protein